MKKSVYLFNKENPQGVMMNLTAEEVEAKLAGDWQDTPLPRNLPANGDTGITEEQAKNADPGQLVKLVESYGFIVMTKEQLQAEAVKMSDMVLDITRFDDEEFIAEAERRGLKEPDSTAEGKDYSDFLEKFEIDPTSLNKEELLEYGNAAHNLGLRMNYSEATMIERITEALGAE